MSSSTKSFHPSPHPFTPSECHPPNFHFPLFHSPQFPFTSLSERSNRVAAMTRKRRIWCQGMCLFLPPPFFPACRGCLPLRCERPRCGFCLRLCPAMRCIGCSKKSFFPRLLHLNIDMKEERAADTGKGGRDASRKGRNEGATEGGGRKR